MKSSLQNSQGLTDQDIFISIIEHICFKYFEKSKIFYPKIEHICWGSYISINYLAQRYAKISKYSISQIFRFIS